MILISFIGLSDPISNDYEGPIMHISKYYKPKKAYFLMTNTLYNDVFFKNIINGLKYINNKIREEDIYFINAKIDNPAIFSDFSLSKYVDEIIEENKNEEFIYNLSSGTPQMLSALALDIVLNDRKGKFIQVHHPEFNKKIDNVKELKLEDFDNIYDNLENRNRTLETNIYSFKINQIKDSIINNTNKRDYRTLMSLLNKYKNDYLKGYELLHKLIEDVYNSDILNNSHEVKYNSLIRFSKYKNKQFQTENVLINYYLAWENEVMRENYISSMLRFKPLFYEVLKYILFKHYEKENIKLSYKFENGIKKYGFLYTDDIKEFDDNILNLNGFNRNSNRIYLDTNQLLNLIDYYNVDFKFKDKLKEIREIEKDIRNKLAHDINNEIKNQTIKSQTLRTYDLIKEIIKELFKQIDNSINYDYFKKMNKLIIKEAKSISKGDKDG